MSQPVYARPSIFPRTKPRSVFLFLPSLMFVLILMLLWYEFWLITSPDVMIDGFAVDLFLDIRRTVIHNWHHVCFVVGQLMS